MKNFIIVLLFLTSCIKIDSEKLPQYVVDQPLCVINGFYKGKRFMPIKWYHTLCKDANYGQYIPSIGYEGDIYSIIEGHMTVSICENVLIPLKSGEKQCE